MNKIFNSDKGLFDFVWTQGPDLIESAQNKAAEASQATQQAIDAA